MVDSGHALVGESGGDLVEVVGDAHDQPSVADAGTNIPGGVGDGVLAGRVLGDGNIMAV
jgi:hypothetical protein